MASVSRSIISQFVAGVLIILSSMMSNLAIAEDDAYLKMLEGEAEDVKLDQSGQLKDKQLARVNLTDGITKTDWTWEGDLEGNQFPAGLATDEFSTLLKQQFYGTFAFYRKLNTVDQNTVYHQYRQVPVANLDSIRQDIMNLLKR